METVRQLGWELAQGAVRHATSIGARINVSVLDAGGNPLAFLRMPGAPLHSIGISDEECAMAGLAAAELAK